jgi:hypothetical protein
MAEAKVAAEEAAASRSAAEGSLSGARAEFEAADKRARELSEKLKEARGEVGTKILLYTCFNVVGAGWLEVFEAASSRTFGSCRGRSWMRPLIPFPFPHPLIPLIPFF